MRPTPNALQYNRVSYSESATLYKFALLRIDIYYMETSSTSKPYIQLVQRIYQGEQHVIYIQTMHAADILFIKESRKPVQKSPATQVKGETVCRLGL